MPQLQEGQFFKFWACCLGKALVDALGATTLHPACVL
jgi:hypothetical protein